MLQNTYLTYLKEHYPQHLEHYYKRKEVQNYVVNEFTTFTEEEYRQQILIKDGIAKKYLEQYIENCLNENNVSLFNKLEIETVNQCNNTCAFCPVNIKKDIRKHILMSMELFHNIVLQLAELNYKGCLNLFSNNEPLLDPYLLDRLIEVRKYLPNVYTFIYTNGLLLTPQKLLQLLPYVNYIHINNYNTKPELLAGHKKLQETLMEHQIPADKVEIHLRNKTECLSTRAGQAPNRNDTANLTSPCILPFSQMVIRPDGKVSYCCNDAYGLYTLGDSNSETLSDIWYGKAFEESRKNMLKERSITKPCADCDMLFMPLAFEEYNTEVNKT